MSDLAYIAEVDNRVEEVNKSFLDLTGYTERSILGRNLEEIWQQVLRISMDLNRVKCLKECNCYMFDILRRAKEVTISYTENPERRQCVYTIRIKKNSMLEDKFPFLELTNSANDTGVALYSVPEFILLKGNENHSRYISRFFDGTEDIIGKRIEEILPDWKGSDTENIFSSVVRTGKPIFYDEHIREYPGTGVICTRYTLTPIFEEEELRYLVLIHNDVTEKVRIRNALSEKNHIIEGQKDYFEKQRNYLYRLFNAMDMPIMSFSYPELKIKEFNNKALYELRELTGISDLIVEPNTDGENLSELIPFFNENNEKKLIERMKETKSSVCHKKMELCKKGRMVYYDVTYHPFLNMMEEITEILIVAVDVTDEVEKEKQMENILELKDEFLYFITHEFKTPLSVINAAVQTLEHCYSMQIPDKARFLIAKVKQNSYRQLRLVNNLLEIARINSGCIKLKQRNVDIVFLTRAITESVAIYAQQKGIELVFVAKFPQRVIGLDDEKLERVLLNLLSNAIKFTPAGRKVVVELSSGLHKHKRVICIKVKDQGIGIPKEKQDVIFDRFGQVDNLLTGQAEGSGIGLYLVKLMVNSIGGDITLESEWGKGSVFTIMIPSKKAKNNTNEQKFKLGSDNRLIQSTAIEFSDIYIRGQLDSIASGGSVIFSIIYWNMPIGVSTLTSSLTF
ncbi:MAG TPA: ATP-binding protein, partial [Bacillota bacterium]|nr:ATP-binding protein [Bacillota bacterium]